MTRREKLILIAVCMVCLPLPVGIGALAIRAFERLPEWWASDPLQVIAGAAAIPMVIGMLMCMCIKDDKPASDRRADHG